MELKVPNEKQTTTSVKQIKKGGRTFNVLDNSPKSDYSNMPLGDLVVEMINLPQGIGKNKYQESKLDMIKKEMNKRFPVK